jgi:hypothetical protein
MCWRCVCVGGVTLGRWCWGRPDREGWSWLGWLGDWGREEKRASRTVVAGCNRWVQQKGN